MKKINFKTGGKVRLKGCKRAYRYVSRNIIRDIESGKVYSVKMCQLRPYNETYIGDFIVIVAACIIGISFIIYSLI
jgi:hypothetical protein